MKEKFKEFLYKIRYGIIAVLIIAMVLFWDMLIKFATNDVSFTLIKKVISIFSIHNTGGAWSIFADKTWLLIVLSCVFIVAIILFHIFFKKKTVFYSISLGLVLGGAFGNLIDRLAFGYVRDFIRLDFLPWFPIFNIADICLVAGVICLCIFFIILLPNEEKRIKQKQERIEAKTKHLKDIISDDK